MNAFEVCTGRQQRPADNRFQRTALRAAAEPERWTDLRESRAAAAGLNM